MHTALLPQLCRRLCAVAVWPLLILSAVRADGEPFVARFETDASGTWLTYSNHGTHQRALAFSETNQIR